MYSTQERGVTTVGEVLRGVGINVGAVVGEVGAEVGAVVGEVGAEVGARVGPARTHALWLIAQGGQIEKL